jgi:TolB-like protein/lipoprotein NlpI
MSQSRQLAAIMFADIMGYTALMQEDETLALQLRHKLKTKLEEETAVHHGRILEFRGDGAMCSFTSTIEGVRAALALQLNMQTDPVVPLRIGMHTGDVIFEGNNIYGDGVNIASRMESFALPGSIFISGKAYDDIKNQKDIQTVSLGMYALKNVKDVVEIFAISNPGIKIPDTDSLEGKGEKVQGSESLKSTIKESTKKFSEKSIAVLPFANMSNDPEQEYFSDGMAEEILNSLTHLKDLKVAGRTSAFQFKGKNIDLREVGDKLGVSKVLEGSVRKQGNRLRITAQLINVDDGFHLWSERYDRDMDDIFAIQDEIALAITEKLKVTLLEKDRELITKTSTQNTAAYDLYLKGRFYLSRRGKFILNALEYFQQAIDLDSSFTLAWAGYADASFISSFYSILPGNVVMDKGKQAAETAIKLDPSRCEPYSSLGFYYTVLMREWEKGKECFKKSLQLNPSYSFGHYLFGLYYYAWGMGKFEEAEQHGLTAIKLEPLSSITYAIYSLILISAGKIEDALAAAKTGIELDANSFLCRRAKSISLRILKRYDEAIESAEHLIKTSDRHPHAVCDLMGVYSDTGNMEEVKIMMEELKQRSASEFIDAVYMGHAAALAGNLDEAFNYMATALTERDPMLITLKYLEYSSTLYHDPRFENLLDQIGFPK